MVTLDTAVVSRRSVVLRYPVADVQGKVGFLVRLDAAFDHRGCHDAVLVPGPASGCEVARALGACSGAVKNRA